MHLLITSIEVQQKQLTIVMQGTDYPKLDSAYLCCAQKAYLCSFIPTQLSLEQIEPDCSY